MNGLHTSIAIVSGARPPPEGLFPRCGRSISVQPVRSAVGLPADGLPAVVRLLAANRHPGVRLAAANRLAAAQAAVGEFSILPRMTRMTRIYEEVKKMKRCEGGV